MGGETREEYEARMAEVQKAYDKDYRKHKRIFEKTASKMFKELGCTLVHYDNEFLRVAVEEEDVCVNLVTKETSVVIVNYCFEFEVKNGWFVFGKTKHSWFNPTLNRGSYGKIVDTPEKYQKAFDKQKEELEKIWF